MAISRMPEILRTRYFRKIIKSTSRRSAYWPSSEKSRGMAPVRVPNYNRYLREDINE
ncbi:hypothetical protein KCP75_10180 [Salmonella enterica subsp. enterica]|nr:hypothetical protein KCP75_10180 [Salmonella enterica subsp. enterica]